MRFSLPELSLFALAAVLLVEALLGRALLGELPRWSRPGGPSSAILASWTITPGVVNPDVTQAILQRIQALAPPEQVVSARLLPTGAPEQNGAKSKSVLDSLEEEMASLLGRPPEKQ